MIAALIMAGTIFAGRGGCLSFHFSVHNFRACHFRRLLRCVVSDARASHAAYGCDQCDFIRDYCRRACGCGGWDAGRLVAIDMDRRSRRSALRGQYFRRLPRHPAHARHV